MPTFTHTQKLYCFTKHTDKRVRVRVCSCRFGLREIIIIFSMKCYFLNTLHKFLRYKSLVSSELCQISKYNRKLYEFYRSPDIMTSIMTARLRWAGHAQKMNEEDVLKRITKCTPERKRGRGRHRLCLLYTSGFYYLVLVSAVIWLSHRIPFTVDIAISPKLIQEYRR